MGTEIAHRFTIRYILALSVLATLTIWGHVLVQRQLDDQQNDAYVINHAGRQRFQSQQIMKDVLLLAQVSQSAKRDSLQRNLRATLLTFENFHYQLKSGRLASANGTFRNSLTTNRLYTELEPHFLTISQQARQLLTKNVLPAKSALVTQAMLNHESRFLFIMNQIVGQYQQEAQNKVTAQVGVEKMLMIATLLILLLEALLIFHPAVSTLRKAVAQLTQSEQQMREANHQLQQTNKELQITQDKLLKETSTRYRQKLADQRLRLGLLVQGQEDERKRLSRELHDGIGQMLTGLKLLSENIRSANQLTEKDQQTFHNLKVLLIRTIQETRNVSNNLMPPVLSDFGLESALRQLVEQESRQNEISIELHSDFSGGRFGHPVEIGLYRIAQEALHNAIKHAQASEVQVSLVPDGDKISLNVDDNGSGFKPQRVQTGSHGLHNMRERTRLLNGTFEINSELGEGTSVRVLIPV